MKQVFAQVIASFAVKTELAH